MVVKTLLITQARYGSTRLPGKVLKKINNKTILEILLLRLQECNNVDEIIVATTTNEIDLQIEDEVKRLGFKSFRGSENDVLDRYFKAANEIKPTWVIRITSDCPLIDPQLIDEVIEFTQNADLDYGANIFEEKFPDGQDIEVFKFSALEKAWQMSSLDSDREHVTPFIRRNSSYLGGDMFISNNFGITQDYSKIRMTVDEPEDLILITNLVENLGIDKTWKEYVSFLLENNLFKLNENIIRNEGYIKSIKNDK